MDSPRLCLGVSVPAGLTGCGVSAQRCQWRVRDECCCCGSRRGSASVQECLRAGRGRTRSLWMATRTSRINALRGFCSESGIAISQGSRLGLEQIGRSPRPASRRSASLGVVSPGTHPPQPRHLCARQQGGALLLCGAARSRGLRRRALEPKAAARDLCLARVNRSNDTDELAPSLARRLIAHHGTPGRPLTVRRR
jgi:hypothetical protein